MAVVVVGIAVVVVVVVVVVVDGVLWLSAELAVTSGGGKSHHQNEQLNI